MITQNKLYTGASVINKLMYSGNCIFQTIKHVEEEEDTENPLTFVNAYDIDGLTVSLKQTGTINNKTFLYRVNKGNWQNYTINQEVEIPVNGSVSFKSEDELPVSINESNYRYFTLNKNVNVKGDISSLNNFNPTIREYECYKLFNNSGIVNASNLILSSTELAKACYKNMFSYCKNLIGTPKLPVTTLVDLCYENMFEGCSSLSIAPELPATTFAFGCYSAMFKKCTSLEYAPELNAPVLNASACYNAMFEGCSNLKYVKALFTTRPSSSYTNVWLSGVSSTGTFVKNKNATWNVTGSSGVPSGWTIKYE